MAFQPVDDTARFAMVHDDSGSVNAINVLYFRNQTAWGLTELGTAVSTLVGLWTANVVPLLSQGTRFLRIEARGERTQVDVSFQLQVTPAATGGVGGEALPLQCSLCVTHLSGYTGRSARGRTYFAFLPEEKGAGGLLYPNYADQFVTALETIRTQMSALGWTHVIVSRYSNKVKRPTALTLEVLGYRLRDREVDTQRRRTRANAP